MDMKQIEEFKNKIICGDSLEVLKTLPADSVDCIITSPPYYGLRDYGVEGQIGLEKTLAEYLDRMLTIPAECKRILKPVGVMFWNHGDSYGTGSGTGIRNGKQATVRGTQMNKTWQREGKKKIIGYEKSLLFQNFRLAIRMCDEQKWIARNLLIWHKPNVMPSSAKDRFTVDFEPVFFFSKSKKYWFETQYEQYAEPMNRWGGDNLKANGKSEWDNETGQTIYRDRNMRPNSLGRNKRAVWKIATHPFKEAHFATFPEALIEPMIKAGCPQGGVVLDPFFGAGTSGMVAKKLGRNFIGIELNPDYIEIANKRLASIQSPML